MKNRRLIEKLGDFVLGKGFYIVLFLCVATIGISGYYVIRTMNPAGEAAEPAGGDTSVVLPDSEANGPDPVGTISPEPEENTQTAGKAQVEVPVPKDDPEPVKKPTPEDQPEEPKKPAALVFTWPVKGEVLRTFSVETLALDPTLGDWRTHDGLDIAASQGTKVLAMAAGTVTQVYDDGLMGTTVVVDHGNGLTTLYANLAQQPMVKAGDAVETGTVLGTVGSTAIAESSMNAHLHLEAWDDGVPVDPADYLPEK